MVSRDATISNLRVLAGSLLSDVGWRLVCQYPAPSLEMRCSGRDQWSRRSLDHFRRPALGQQPHRPCRRQAGCRSDHRLHRYCPSAFGPDGSHPPKRSTTHSYHCKPRSSHQHHSELKPKLEPKPKPESKLEFESEPEPHLIELLLKFPL